MKDHHINVFPSDKDGGYIANIPDLPYCSAFGNTPEEAVRQVMVAKKAWLRTAKKSGKEIPPPRYRGAMLHTEQILHAMEFIAEYPCLCGRPLEEAEVEIHTLAAVVLQQAFDRPIEVAHAETFYLVLSATKDVPRSRCQVVYLRDEVALPSRRSSDKAFSRHAKLFLKLLKRHLSTGRPVPIPRDDRDHYERWKRESMQREYVAMLVQIDQLKRDRKRIDALLEEALSSGPARPLTQAAWRRIERQVFARRSPGLKPPEEAKMSMERRAFARPRAQSDLIALGWYVGLPEVFLRNAWEAVRRLAETPEYGIPWESASDGRSSIRVWASPIKPFDNYLIFYAPTEVGINIIRVLHADALVAELPNEEKKTPGGGYVSPVASRPGVGLVPSRRHSGKRIASVT